MKESFFRALPVKERPANHVFILVRPDESTIVWRAAPHGGWSTQCACGRTLDQFLGARDPVSHRAPASTRDGQRPSAVQCPNCRKWTEAP
jgi:hypothetical protein